MFSFFKKKTLITDIEWLGVDIHSHLLPGIDDGSTSIEHSIKLIKGLSELGFSKFICTPHIFNELYPNTRETILPALGEIKVKLMEVGLGVGISAAAEYMLDETFKIVEGLLCLKDKFILVEMSYLNETPDIDKKIFDLQIAGYTVVLAHPERYVFYHKAHDRYHRLKEMGCLFQLNLLSVSGYYGKTVKIAAEYLLSENVYDYAGTDLHHEQHLNALTNVVRSGALYERIGKYPFKNQQL